MQNSDWRYMRIWSHWHVARIISSQKIYGLYGLKHHIVEMRGGVTDAGQTTTNIEDRATQPMDDIDGGWVSQQARKPQSFTSWKLQGWGSTRIEVKCYLVKLELRWAETPLLIRHFQQFQHSKTLSTLLIFSRDCWYIWWEQSWGLDENTNW